MASTQYTTTVYSQDINLNGSDGIVSRFLDNVFDDPNWKDSSENFIIELDVEPHIFDLFQKRELPDNSEDFVKLVDFLDLLHIHSIPEFIYQCYRPKIYNYDRNILLKLGISTVLLIPPCLETYLAINRLDLLKEEFERMCLNGEIPWIEHLIFKSVRYDRIEAFKYLMGKKSFLENNTATVLQDMYRTNGIIANIHRRNAIIQLNPIYISKAICNNNLEFVKCLISNDFTMPDIISINKELKSLLPQISKELFEYLDNHYESLLPIQENMELYLLSGNKDVLQYLVECDKYNPIVDHIQIIEDKVKKIKAGNGGFITPYTGKLSCIAIYLSKCCFKE